MEGMSVAQVSCVEQAMQSKQMSGWCKRTSKWTSKWPSAYLSIDDCFEPQCIVGNISNNDFTHISSFYTTYALTPL